MECAELRKTTLVHDMTLIGFTELSIDEAKEVREMRNHESVRRWMNTDHLISVQEHERFLSGLSGDNKNFYYLVKQNSVYLGVISLNRYDERNRNSYLGIYANPFLHETGIGGRLMHALKHIAFSRAGLHTLKLEVIESNARAIALYRKTGFIEEGRLKEFVWKNGRWYDMVIMGMVEGNI